LVLNLSAFGDVEMIFNSYTYLLLFLPFALLGFSIAARFKLRAGFTWLVLASLFYYGWWNPDPNEPWRPWYVLLILGSCTGNFLAGNFVAKHRQTSPGKTILVIGIVLNLILLGYF